MFEKFSTKSNSTKVSEVLFNVMQFTKDRMVFHYNNRNAEGIRNEYHNFITFTKFLFIRGDYDRYHRQLRLYVNIEMENFMEMLIRK